MCASIMCAMVERQRGWPAACIFYLDALYACVCALNAFVYALYACVCVCLWAKRATCTAFDCKPAFPMCGVKTADVQSCHAARMP
jgi:hypothetical protein